MPKQERVPRALHSELTEHAALLRALKTRHLLGSYTHELESEGKKRRSRPRTQDVWTTWPLPDFPAPEFTLRDEVSVIAERTVREVRRRGFLGDDGRVKVKGEVDEDEQDQLEQDLGMDENEADRNELDDAEAFELGTGEVERLDGASADKTYHEDEDDEGAQEAETRDVHQGAKATGADDSSENSDNDDIEPVSTPALNGLSTESAHTILRLLAELATHRARAAGRSFNRMWPFDWEDVLHVAAARGIVEPHVIEAVYSRLQAIYGPPHTGQEVSYLTDLRPVHKARATASAKAASRQVFTPAFENSFLDVPDISTVRRERQEPIPYYPSAEFILDSDLSDE
ncbi:hypothetical protein CONPUDRAFT_102379 [Coniophora puteana RWD-64-598 SS2]|uniref:Rrn9 domain-containing protein n=1 Tax=Coniophora puteana (strain RWD-64-598) TaxID=741705 RepID=A0A5M3MR66_CONPW|nr:uncharacterized protein CONPUDRAFT_102379 [Coniophora puteana RWD-64-598 SS2]EIW81672.1 hypothetical protein CONPUDRAFT_102379 [Coniophora puteana RWD-64-598 SS2]